MVKYMLAVHHAGSLSPIWGHGPSDRDAHHCWAKWADNKPRRPGMSEHIAILLFCCYCRDCIKCVLFPFRKISAASVLLFRLAFKLFHTSLPSLFLWCITPVFTDSANWCIYEMVACSGFVGGHVWYGGCCGRHGMPASPCCCWVAGLWWRAVFAAAAARGRSVDGQTDDGRVRHGLDSTTFQRRARCRLRYTHRHLGVTGVPRGGSNPPPIESSKMLYSMFAKYTI